VSAEEDAAQVLAAAELLADAIRHRRLPKKPPMETLARIAAIVTVGAIAPAPKTNRHRGQAVAIVKKEVKHRAITTARTSRR